MDKVELRENLVKHVLDQLPNALQSALPALNAYPNDPEALLLTVMAALMDRKPDHALRFLQRFTRKWQSLEYEDQLLRAIALAQQEHWPQAAMIGKQIGWPNLFGAFIHLPGNWALRDWAHGWVRQIERHEDRQKRSGAAKKGLEKRKTEAARSERAAKRPHEEKGKEKGLEPQRLEAMLPENLQRVIGAPEFLRLGFAAELPASAERASLELDWLGKFSRLLDDRGRRLKFASSAEVPPLGHVERLVERAVVLQNAVYRLSRVEPAWTRYLIFVLRYTAISDEKREGIISFGINLINGSAIDPMVDQLLDSAVDENATEAATKPAPSQLPADWTAERLKKAITRAAPIRVRAQLSQFVNGMQRRLDRDLERLHEYFGGLREESWRKLKRQKGDAARERLRIEAAEREYQAKVSDLKQKYDLRVEIEPVQTLELISQVQRVSLAIKRRKGERKLALDWNPIGKQLDPLPCEWSFVAEGLRVICDDQLHIVSPAGHAPCPQCGKEYCRGCSPRRCSKCGNEEKEL